MNAILTLAALKALTKLTAGKCRSNTCLIGKTAIITGATTGIGYETTKVLASRGCRIYLTGMINLNEDIIDLLRIAFNNPEVFYHPINLSSLDSVRRFCDYFRQHETKLDILIHNAEKVGNPRIITHDKLLQVMQVNHLSPFLMTHLLQEQLKKSNGGRIIYVGNVLAYCGAQWDTSRLQYSATSNNHLINLLDYTNSKCFQMVSAKMFADKFRKHNVTCNVVYPGWVDIEDRKVHNNVEAANSMLVDVCKVILDMWIYGYGKTRVEGAQMSLHAALSNELSNKTGKFIMDSLILPLPYYVFKKQYCEEVWKISEELCQLKTNELIL